jgi:CheY-like chemotaxis protein
VPCEVLLVEDNSLVTDALTILLESGGHTVRVAATVAQAVEQATAARPDVLLLDLTLPDGEGLAVLHQLRDTPALPHVTAALTGHDDPAVRARCLAAGCRDVLVKPVPARVLLARVAEWGGEIERRVTSDE